MNGKLLFLLITLVVFTTTSQEDASEKLSFEDVSQSISSTSMPYFSGLNGYFSFRIPALIKTNKTVLAFAEGRKNSTSDFGDIDLVVRRSEDNGQTWAPLQLIYDQDTMAVQNPVPIYLKQENKIILLFNTTTLSEHDILHTDYKEENQRRAYITSSLDDGLSWSTPREITQTVKQQHWRWHALGPVHGIQLRHGANKGRIVVPVAISIKKGSSAYCMALIYSDDSANSWKIGAVDNNLNDAVQSNETTIVELLDGRIYVNTRDHLGGSHLKNRGETYSLDGGLSFEEPIIESDKFPSPIVQSALLRWYPRENTARNMIFFSTPSNPEKREHLIIMLSTDESQSWKTVFKVHNGFAAYSDMVQLDGNTLGVLYETDEYKKILFRQVTIKQ
ncbi:sialidase family protein [Muriicola sp. Z0-33]|uniref:sialidase family protein n=1 Tax=Muriicola sp. Z0-33 TaxID=2816957 RepID=UPI0022385E30|nr:sialidase family protein [Muriicola sp. Z0-33]MCW5516419.1 exo-alpha-sialidase [Muriicola sp. Z0-33]